MNVTVSCYTNYFDTTPVDINLLTFINSRKHKEKIDAIRMMEDKKSRDDAKALIPAITPSGTFTKRDEAHLIKHSGLIQFDIDYKGNEHIDNFEELTHEIGNLPYISYCGFSASGYGIWGLVPIAFPEKHKLHLQALKNVFKQFGIKCDTAPSNVASLRGYSYDDNAHVNHRAEIFTQISKPQVIKINRSQSYETNTERVFERAVKKAQLTDLFVDGAKHSFLVRVAGYCNTFGLDYDTVVGLVEQNFRSMTGSDIDLEKPVANVYKGYKNQFAEYAT